MQFTAFIQDTAERCARTFVTTYGATWLAIKGASYDTLFSLSNVKVSAAATAATLFICLGVKQIGNRNSAGITNTDPKPGPVSAPLTLTNLFPPGTTITVPAPVAAQAYTLELGGPDGPKLTPVAPTATTAPPAPPAA